MNSITTWAKRKFTKEYFGKRLDYLSDFFFIVGIWSYLQYLMSAPPLTQVQCLIFFAIGLIFGTVSAFLLNK